MLFKKPIIHLRNDGKLVFDDTLQINAVRLDDVPSLTIAPQKKIENNDDDFENISPNTNVNIDYDKYELKYYKYNPLGESYDYQFIELSNLPASKKYTLSFSSGTQGFESLIKALNLNDKKVGTSNIVFPSIFSVLTRYVKNGKAGYIINNLTILYIIIYYNNMLKGKAQKKKNKL